MPATIRLFGSFLTFASLAILSATLAGCSSSQPISGDPPPVIEGHEGHDHSGHDHHGHSHADVGPHGGHLLELGEEQFHAEWTHDDDAGKLTVYILDGDAKELVPIAADKLVIEKSVGERTDTYELAAVNPEGETPKSAQFEIVDKGLLAGLKMVGEGVKANLSVDVNGQPFKAEFTKHDDHHGHKH